MIAQLTPPLIQHFLPNYDLPPVPRQGVRVVLLRHGRSTLNDAGCYQGSSDVAELTKAGWLASQQVGQFLQDCPIHQVYVSPLRRAQQTAKALLPWLSPELQGVTATRLLREIDLPDWEGLRYEDVKAQFPDAYHCWQQHPDQFAMTAPKERWQAQPQTNTRDLSAQPSTFYPVRDVYRRAEKFWASALPRHQGQTLLVVSHGSTIQALVNTALNLPMTQHHSFQQTHSGLTVLDFATPTRGAGHLHLLNLTTPIGEPLPKLKAGKQGIRLLLLPCQPRVEVEASLAELASSQPIHACLVEDLPHCHLATQTFLAHHPETVTLAVSRSGFLRQWHQTIEPSLHQTAQADLTTIAAVCGESQVQTFLHHLVGQPLPTLPNALTVLHYPTQTRRPILQTLNARPIS